MPSEIHHVILPVGDMDRALHLFQDHLGFKMLWRIPRIGGRKMADFLGIPGLEAEMAYLQSPSGGAALELIRFIQPAPCLPGGLPGEVRSTGLSLTVSNIENVHRNLADQGWTPLSPVMEMNTPEGRPIRAFCIRTAEGVTLELFEYSGPVP